MPHWIACKERMLEQVIETVLSSTSQDVPVQFLEIGCGLGRDLVDVAKAIIERGRTVAAVGMDFNTQMVDSATETVNMAEERGELPAGSVRVIRGDIFTLGGSSSPVERCQFHVVRADITMQHLGGPEKMQDALAAIHSVLAQDGHFISLEAAISSLVSRDVKLHSMYQRVMPHRPQGGAGSQLQLMAAEAKFSVSACVPVGFVQDGAMLASQDPEWVKLNGMADLMKSKGVMSTEEARDYVKRYTAGCLSGSIAVYGMMLVLDLCKLPLT